MRDGLVAVASEDDLALLGDLETPRHRARCLSHHRAIGRPAAAPERTAPSVEERELHRTLRGPRGEIGLGRIERERGGDRPTLLRRVGVAKHDLDGASGPTHAAAHRFELEHRIQRGASVAQIRGGFEQWHDVELRSCTGRTRQLRELVHVGDVVSALREADHVAMADALAEPLLQQRDGAERRHHLVGLRGARARGAELGERVAMHAAVLADLEVGEVEAEGLHLPDEAMELAECQPRSAGSHQCILEASEVVEQFVGSRISEREISPAGALDSLGHDQEELPERLAGGASFDGARAAADRLAR